MGNMVQANIIIEGTRPLLWNSFGIKALSPERKKKTGSAGNNPEEWRDTVLVTGEGQLYIKPTYIFGSIREGGKYTKRGRSNLKRFIVATLQIVESQILIDRFMPDAKSSYDIMQAGTPSTNPEESIYLDIQGVRNPSTRNQNIRYRIAASPKWRTAFNIKWDATMVSENEMEAAVRDAGRFEGVGDGRKIGMGRFDVVSFEVTELE